MMNYKLQCKHPKSTEWRTYSSFKHIVNAMNHMAMSITLMKGYQWRILDADTGEVVSP